MKVGTYATEVAAPPDRAFERVRALVISRGFPHEAEQPSRVVFTTGDGGALVSHDIRIEPSGAGSRFVYTAEQPNVSSNFGAWVGSRFIQGRYRKFLEELKDAAEAGA
jgi:hypothetical protein